MTDAPPPEHSGDLRKPEVTGGGKHTFTLTVNLRGSGCHWSRDLVPQTIEAYSLVEALRLALEIPFPDWFEG